MSVVNHKSGYHPDFDLDIERGWEAEAETRAVLGELLNAGETIEVKRDDQALITGNIYLEYAHRPRGADEYRDSGLRTTKATYCAYKIGNALLIAPTEAWKQVGREHGHKRECVRGDNPTKGVIVSLQDLVLYLSQANF